MDKIRCVLFNVLFYGVWTPLCCILLLPSLIMPHKAIVGVAKFYQRGAHLLEKYVLGLDYEVRGLEHKPKDGETYLVAAKHYSAYETLKLFILFDDPAIILKKELLSLPVFGWFLKGLDVIAIDRGNRTEAQKSLFDGARKVIGQGRPIVIFPQGTRVPVDATPAQKPYKGGIVKLYDELKIPIYPLALNTGIFWPRNSFWKKPGKVVFEFLPPIPPGLPPSEAMAALEAALEPASARLVAESQAIGS